MNSKFYVSLKAAKLLKEKGYNEECDRSIDDDSYIYECEYRTNQELPRWKWSCPTKAEAIDWLESKGIVVETYCNCNAEWGFTITIDNFETYESGCHDELLFPTRLEAEDAAIIKALELLEKGE